MSHGSGLASVSQNRSNTRILSSRFNQENSCIAVATTNGFRVLNCDPFSKCYEFSTDTAIQRGVGARHSENRGPAKSA